MATIKQIDANRRNAQHSTGPRTQEGKHATSLNALKTGIYAESEVIPGERPEALTALAAEYHAHHRPATPEARDLVDSLVRNAWLLRRLAAAEAGAFNCDCETCRQTYEGLTDLQFVSHRVVRNVKRLDLLQRRINATERNFHRSLKALQTLPSPEPDPQPTDPEPTSENLALFPRSISEPPQTPPDPRPDPVPAPPVPEREPSSSSSASCAPYASPNPEGISAPPEPLL
jgi:hypothetical protein